LRRERRGRREKEVMGVDGWEMEVVGRTYKHIRLQLLDRGLDVFDL